MTEPFPAADAPTRPPDLSALIEGLRSDAEHDIEDKRDIFNGLMYLQTQLAAAEDQITALRAALQGMAGSWRARASETRRHHDMSRTQSLVDLPVHSERTIATLRACADRVDTLLSRAQEPE